MRRRVLVTAAGLFAIVVSACSERHHPPPRPAEFCWDTRAAAPVALLVQDSDSGESCIRVDLMRAPESSSELPVTVEGPWYLYRVVRATGACENYPWPRDIALNPTTVFASREGTAGSLRLDEDSVLSASVTAAFPAAMDGSLGATEETVAAQDVPLTEEACGQP
jgi:hypothetical protein